ncbi:MAG: IS1595 family transposase [Elusimicrobia bacterium]|nr:IS1595 family transposase [Elusimicrobiota bacterium]
MASKYPRTLLEFEHRFRTEESCRDYLASIRWPHGIVCPKCGHGQAWRTSRGVLRCGGCRADIAVTAGTVFEGSKLSLRLWFRAMWWVTNQKSGISALGLQRTLGLGSYRAAWTLLHKLRRAMVRPGRDQLSGEIEVDETIVGGKRKFINGRKPSRYLDKAIVIVAAEVRGKHIGRIRLKQIREPSQEILLPLVKEVAAPGSRILTDGWWGYHGLKKLGFDHKPVPTEGKGREIHDFVSPRVHRVAALLKRWLLGTHQGRVGREQLDYYLDEFTFRFNRRSSPTRGKLFQRLLEQALAIEPSTYHDIIKCR